MNLKIKFSLLFIIVNNFILYSCVNVNPGQTTFIKNEYQAKNMYRDFVKPGCWSSCVRCYKLGENE